MRRRIISGLLALVVILSASMSLRAASIDELKDRAKQGDAAAQLNLGMMYSRGLGVSADKTLALAWLRLAAQQGNAEAKAELDRITEGKEQAVTSSQIGVETRADKYKITGSCDNSFVLYLNGKQVLESDDWSKPPSVALELKEGDVITAVASDLDDGGFSGFALVGITGSTTKFTSADFYYTLSPETDWKTSKSLEGFMPSDPDYPCLTHASSKKLRSMGIEGVNDVWSSELAKTVYFKMVYGTTKLKVNDANETAAIKLRRPTKEQCEAKGPPPLSISIGGPLPVNKSVKVQATPVQQTVKAKAHEEQNAENRQTDGSVLAHAQQIEVISGIYGENCKAREGLKTLWLAAACNGLVDCSYTIRHLDDPAPGCAKDYIAAWRCSGSPEIYRVVVNPEALGKTVELKCSDKPHQTPATTRLISAGNDPALLNRRASAMAPQGVYRRTNAHEEQNAENRQTDGSVLAHAQEIEVFAGTYGENCNARQSDVTKHLATSCDGRTECSYRIDHGIIGDPADGCAKNYIAKWRCSGSPEIYSSIVSPEASGRTVELKCSDKPQQTAATTRPLLAGIDPALLNRRASAMAPQGVYRRNIGYMSTESPVGDSQLVEVDGYSYFYDRGVFWVQQGTRFVVVASPVGAVVNTLPVGAEKLPGRKDSIYYWFGAFFGEKDGKYEVLKPPNGAVVGYLPEGYKQIVTSNSASYSCDVLCFKPLMVQGRLMYQVDDCVTETKPVVVVEDKITDPDYIKLVGTCDNIFTLSVNGRKVLQSDDWTKPVSESVELKDGDVITAVATDTNDGTFCGFAVAGLEGRRTKFTSTDFFYTLNPVSNWETSTSLEGFKPADPYYSGLSHVAAKQLEDPRIRDVWSSEQARTVYFKMVYGETKGEITAQSVTKVKTTQMPPSQFANVSSPTVVIRPAKTGLWAREDANGIVTVDWNAQVFPAKKLNADGTKKKNPVKFNHKAHGDSFGCDKCHHTEFNESCFVCHGPEEKGKQIDTYVLIHGKTGKCLACHKDQKAKDAASKAPTACKQCHDGVE